MSQHNILIMLTYYAYYFSFKMCVGLRMK